MPKDSLTNPQEIVNKAGKTQVTLMVRDGVSKEKITMFDMDVQTLQEQFPFAVPKSVIVLTITKKDPYYNATRYVSKPTEEFDLSEIAQKATDRDPEEIFASVLKMVKDVARPGEYPVARIAYQVYRARKEDILRSTSALGHHHVGLTGNILHTEEVMKICSKLLETTIGEDVDAELLLTAAALHDIGKIDCYATDEVGEATMTFEGSAMGGHHYGSLKAIDDVVREGDYDPERVTILKNIVASHHGKREFGDIATAMTLEGFLLHYADELDAKHFAVRSKILEAAPGKFVPWREGDVTYSLYRRTDQ